jgi:hypothetical protein
MSLIAMAVDKLKEPELKKETKRSASPLQF